MLPMALYPQSWIGTGGWGARSGRPRDSRDDSKLAKDAHSFQKSLYLHQVWSPPAGLQNSAGKSDQQLVSKNAWKNYIFVLLLFTTKDNEKVKSKGQQQNWLVCLCFDMGVSEKISFLAGWWNSAFWDWNKGIEHSIRAYYWCPWWACELGRGDRCPEDDTVRGSTARTNNPSGPLGPKDPHRLHSTDRASQQPTYSGREWPCNICTWVFLYVKIVLLIKNTNKPMWYLRHCTLPNISFPAECLLVGWWVWYFTVLWSRTGQPSPQYLFVIWSFGCDRNALSQQTAIS